LLSTTSTSSSTTQPRQVAPRDSIIIVKKQAAHCIVRTIKPVPVDNTFYGCIVQRVHSSTMRLIMMSNKGNETSNIVCLSLLVLNFSFPASSSKQPVARVPACSNHRFLVQSTIQAKIDHGMIVWNFDDANRSKSCWTTLACRYLFFG